MSFLGQSIDESKKISFKKSDKKIIDYNNIQLFNMDLSSKWSNSKSGEGPLESGTTSCESNPSSVDTDGTPPMPNFQNFMNNDTDTDDDNGNDNNDNDSNNKKHETDTDTDTDNETNINLTPEPKNKKSTDNDKKYVCVRCSKEFNSKSHLTQHYKKKFVCVKNTTNVKELTTKPPIDGSMLDDHKNMSELFTNYKQINQQLVQQNIMLTNKINAITAILFPTNNNNNEI